LDEGEGDEKEEGCGGCIESEGGFETNGGAVKGEEGSGEGGG
jgi:hypothetical protein